MKSTSSSRSTISDFADIPGTESNADVDCIIEDLSDYGSIGVVRFDEQLQSTFSCKNRNNYVIIMKRGRDELLMNNFTFCSRQKTSICHHALHHGEIS